MREGPRSFSCLLMPSEPMAAKPAPAVTPTLSRGDRQSDVEDGSPPDCKPAAVDSPTQEDADLAQIAVRVAHDLGSDLVAKILEVLLVELHRLLRPTLQGLGPVRLAIVDGT